MHSARQEGANGRTRLGNAKSHSCYKACSRYKIGTERQKDRLSQHKDNVQSNNHKNKSKWYRPDCRKRFDTSNRRPSYFGRRREQCGESYLHVGQFDEEIELSQPHSHIFGDCLGNCFGFCSHCVSVLASEREARTCRRSADCGNPYGKIWSLLQNSYFYHNLCQHDGTGNRYFAFPCGSGFVGRRKFLLFHSLRRICLDCLRTSNHHCASAFGRSFCENEDENGLLHSLRTFGRQHDRPSCTCFCQ